MAIEGDLGVLALHHVLESVAAQGKSGILTVQGSDDIVAVSFLEGEVVSADALNQTVEDGLGAVLESRNLVSAADFASVSREHQGGSTGSLGDLLVSRELIARNELLQALRIQTYQLMVQILGWKEGEFKFYVGDEISFEEGFKPLPVEEILIRSINDSEGPGGLEGSVPALDSLYRRVPPREVVKIFGQDGEGMDGGIWLTSRQADLMNRLDGKTTIVAAGASLGMGEHAATYALYKLLRHDLAETTGTAATPPSKTARRQAAAPTPAPRPTPAAPAPRPVPPPQSMASGSGTIAAPPPSSLRAEILVPPGREDTDSAIEADAAPAVQTVRSLHPFIGPVLAAALLLALFIVFQIRPSAFLMPFPWQDNQRDAVHQHLRQTLFGKIEQANRAYFLMQAHYPDSLQELAELGLLTKGDLQDPAAYELSYTNDAVGYRLTLLEDGETLDGLGTTKTLRDDFLLNPRFLRTTPSEGVPLVLID